MSTSTSSDPLPRLDLPALSAKADAVRRDVIKVCVANGAGHIAPSLSCVDLLTALYYRVMNIAADPLWDERDRLVFSKAHGGYGLYAILTDLGWIAHKDWESFYQGGPLSGCLSRSPERGIEAGCGSLGHGLPQAVGLAFGARLQKKRWSVYCVVGDGEMQEGSNWEALQFASKHELSDLVVVVDANALQAMDFLKDVLSPEDPVKDLREKLEAFGAETAVCAGHDMAALLEGFAGLKPGRRPRVLIARTVKGYGLRCMEGVAKFHFRLPTPEELEQGGRAL
ncbi:MAG: transketolase [Elusimicrobia bacterium]|nr:transketolase [Elusimicrobiota bacterium]